MNASKTLPLLAAALLPLAAAACLDEPSLPGSTLNAAVLYGRVTNPAGAPLPQSPVMVEMFEKRGTCLTTVLGTHRAETDLGGAYRLTLYGPPLGSRYDACLRVRVDPPADSLSLQGTTVTGTEVRLLGEAPYDSLQLNVTLARRP